MFPRQVRVVRSLIRSNLKCVGTRYRLRTRFVEAKQWNREFAFSATPGPMQPLTILVSLITEENDFQMEQAASAQAAAMRLGVQIQIVYAVNDAVNQNQ